MRSWTLVPVAFAAAVAVGMLVLVSPESAAEAPWSLPLEPAQEQAVLERALDSFSPDDPVRGALPEAAAAGMLMASGHCESSGTVRQDLRAEWIGEVESVATVELANLSDEPIWLIEIGISSAREYTDLAKLAKNETGAWSANLPFLPPHSSTHLQMGCNAVLVGGVGGVAADGMSLDALSISSEPGEMTRRLAERMVKTPARFDHSAKWGKLVGASRPSSRSLAELALPVVGDRGAARILAAAIDADEVAADRLPRLLGAAELEAAHGIVDMFETIPGDALVELLAEVLPHRSEANDEALARLVTHICADVEPEVRRDLTLETLSETGRLWKVAYLGACALDEIDALYIIDALVLDVSGRFKANDDALAEFIELAGPVAFEAALPTLLGAREPGTRIPGEELEFEILGPEPEPEPEPEPGQEPEPELVDGGERPGALWRALAWPPKDPARQAALEQLIRPQDVATVLGVLVPTQMSEERLALFDRVAAQVGSLPAAARGPALVPVMRAGLDSPYLEPELTERLFALSDNDRPTLRPIMMEAMAKNQDVFTAEALAAFEHDYTELLALFQGPLDGCALHIGTLETCFDAIEADPAMRQAAQTGGLRPKLLAKIAKALAQPDPTPRQRDLLARAAAFGVSSDPAAEAVCARFDELAAFDLEREAHRDFLREVTPDHPCAQAIADAEGGQRRMLLMGFGLGLGAVVLGVLVARRRRRRTAALLDELSQ